MGHLTENLVSEDGLEGFSGIVLSPVNRQPGDLARDIQKFRTVRSFDIVFDPQLYSPRDQRGELGKYSYYPSDIETAEFGNANWWKKLTEAVCESATSLGVDAICSPITLPAKTNDSFYSQCADNFELLRETLAHTSVRPLMTLLVHLRDLESPDDAMRIASIVTRATPSGCYLIYEAEQEGRKEISNPESLYGLMVLIAALERANCRVLASHASAELLLLKAAGATSCSTGKYFNLRRFTRKRFTAIDDDAGGTQSAYWFEHSLLANLKAADIVRLRRDGFTEFLSVGPSRNRFSDEILEIFQNGEGTPWVKLGWCQYLAWFASAEAALAATDASEQASIWLKEAEQRWGEMDEEEFLLTDIRNVGDWVRKWRQALGDFRKHQW